MNKIGPFFFCSEANVRQRPVMIHRAVLGSVERMIAVLTENYGGKWPFWISPRQALVVPIHPAIEEYAVKVQKTVNFSSDQFFLLFVKSLITFLLKIYEAGFECDLDADEGDTLNKKIRNGQLAQYNFILVVGEKESLNGTVNVRTRDNKVFRNIFSFL